MSFLILDTPGFDDKPKMSAFILDLNIIAHDNDFIYFSFSKKNKKNFDVRREHNNGSLQVQSRC